MRSGWDFGFVWFRELGDWRVTLLLSAVSWGGDMEKDVLVSLGSSDRTCGSGSKLHQKRFRTLGRISSPRGWLNARTGFLERWLTPQACHCWRHLAMPFIIRFNFWWALKWSGSWNRWSLKFTSKWSILFYFLSRKLLHIHITRWGQHLFWAAAFSSPPVKVTASINNRLILLFWSSRKDCKLVDYRKLQRKPAFYWVSRKRWIHESQCFANVSYKALPFSKIGECFPITVHCHQIPIETKCKLISFYIAGKPAAFRFQE